MVNVIQGVSLLLNKSSGSCRGRWKSRSEGALLAEKRDARRHLE